jgi:MerR family transcriptional regulator, light-induced transcriptional regulator
MQIYQIHDLETISGIKAHTIRIWEKRFKLFIPKRTDTNIRLYSDEDLRKLLSIVVLLANGYKISKIALLEYSELSQMVREIELYNTFEESLILAMINFDGNYFNLLLEKSIIANGFESTCKNLIFPLQTRIGMLWLTGAITPSHEHFVSNIIRQKLFAQIDALPQPTKQKKKIMFFLPEKELHE